MKIENVSVLKFFIVYIILSGGLIVGLYNFFEGDFFLLKDLPVVALVIMMFFMFSRNFPLAVFRYLIPIFLFIIMSFFMSDASAFLAMASFRQLVMPFVFILIGYVFIKSIKDYDGLVKTVISVMFVIVMFGLFERFFLIWTFIDVSSFYNFKNISVFHYGYPVFWIEPVSLFGYQTFENGIPRMVSLILDPVNLGHMLVCVFLLVLFEGRKFLTIHAHYFMILVFFIGILLTFSKGSWLQLFLAAIILNHNISIFFKFIGFVISLPFVYLYVSTHAGFMAHFYGFISIYDHITLFGDGLGSYGNYSRMFSEDYVDEVGDSYWAAVIGQIGILGFFTWIMTFIFIAKKNGFNHYLSWLLLSQVFVSSLSENTFNFMSVFLMMIFVGAYLRIRVRGQER
ncbi:MAG: hypothetical protein R6W78_08765 [Bacteroidales bacterium]